MKNGRTTHRSRGMTLLEVILATFILLVGIIGVLAAIPTGVSTADDIIFNDVSLHLSHSKFDEFARDRIDPAVDLQPGSTYLNGQHGPINSSPGGVWRDFAHKRVDFDNGDPYEYFDDIYRYEWKVEIFAVGSGTGGDPAPPLNSIAPIHGGGTDIGLSRAIVTIHRKGTTKEHAFTQYLFSYGN